MAQCSGNGTFVFVGDTGTRQVFWAAARKIEGNSKWVFTQQAKHPYEHKDLTYVNEGVKLKFIWDPFLNGSSLAAELRAFKERLEPPKLDLRTGTYTRGPKWKDSRTIFIGGGHWHARHLGSDAVAQFKRTVDNITALAYPKDTMLGWKSLAPYGSEGVSDQILFAPVLEPRYDVLSPSREATISPAKILEMNGYLQQMSADSRLTIPWSFTNMVKNQTDAYGDSGLHVYANVASKMADVLLNLRCNGKVVAQQDDVPRDRTCCTRYRPEKWTLLLCQLVPGWVLLASFWRMWRPTSGAQVRGQKLQFGKAKLVEVYSLKTNLHC